MVATSNDHRAYMLKDQSFFAAWEDAAELLEESPEKSAKDNSNGSADGVDRSKDDEEAEAEEEEAPKKGTPCLCGAGNCKKVLFGK